MEKISENLFSAFQTIENEFDELQELVSSVEIMSDHKLFAHYAKRLKKIESLANNFKKYKLLIADEDNADVCLQAENVIAELKKSYSLLQEKQEETVQIEICSKEDVEFLRELGDVFKLFAKHKQLKIVEESETIDTIRLKLSGDGVYELLKMFSGRVKKVSCGNEVFASIVVLKIESFFTEIKQEDLIIQTSKSGGAGGQHINKTESAVKIIHKPTGISAECQDERSQSKNKERAMERLVAKITQNANKKREKHEKNQRNELKTLLFGASPILVFDFDLNRVFAKLVKSEYMLKDILEGKLELIFNNQM